MFPSEKNLKKGRAIHRIRSEFRFLKEMLIIRKFWQTKINRKSIEFLNNFKVFIELFSESLQRSLVSLE